MTSTKTATEDASRSRSETRTADATGVDTEPETETEAEAEHAVADLPPSAKLVYTVLDREGPLTQGEIAVESRLCPRTVRYALAKLEDRDVVTSRIDLRDARRSVYRLVDS